MLKDSDKLIIFVFFKLKVFFMKLLLKPLRICSCWAMGLLRWTGVHIHGRSTIALLQENVRVLHICVRHRGEENSCGRRKQGRAAVGDSSAKSETHWHPNTGIWDGSVFSQGSVQVTLPMLSGLSNSSSLHSLMAYKAFSSEDANNE